ncbi:MAG: sigma-54-dependent Fis family transcriptional regulator [Candidatus Wallbacteria bacterium]|nr:sigma-54-dependent Fis family transcriptional regulator [Candidatus Wallbacteria bacterium]
MSIYFHILGLEEIDALRQPLRLLSEHRDEVVREWFELYQLRFPEGGMPDASAMAGVYAADLDEMLRALLERDMERFATLERSAGAELARSVSYAEVVAVLHLFEEASTRVLERRAKEPLPPDTYLILDKVSHCRMILFADAFFASRDRVLGRAGAESAPGPGAPDSFHGIVGKSPAILKVLEQVRAAGRGSGSVLIAGESGTGKEMVARAIHECSGDPRRPFVPVNCAALPPELIESELFGHRKGSFSGALDEYIGLIRAADGGTLFLDEVTEMDQQTQAKLLRVLQERLVRPVGSTREVSVEIRILASTNRAPDQAVDEGLLRRDLYYRLQTHVIKIPPLRDRVEDIASLATHFIASCNQRQKRDVAGLHTAAMDMLLRYDWPGNVRELSNVIERAFTFGLGQWISTVDLPEEISGGGQTVSASGAPSRPTEETRGGVRTVAQAERDALVRALQATAGNKVRAARMLGISRHGLYSKLKKFGLE